MKINWERLSVEKILWLMFLSPFVLLIIVFIAILAFQSLDNVAQFMRNPLADGAGWKLLIGAGMLWAIVNGLFGKKSR